VDARAGAAGRLATGEPVSEEVEVPAPHPELVNGGGPDQKVATVSGGPSATTTITTTNGGGRTITVYSEGPSPGWSWTAWEDQWWDCT
jgi:hypothetical protein